MDVRELIKYINFTLSIKVNIEDSYGFVILYQFLANLFLENMYIYIYIHVCTHTCF